MDHAAESKDFRIAALVVIGTFTTGMLGICVPLVEKTQSGTILPMTVLIGWGLSILVIWFGPNRSVIVPKSDRLNQPTQPKAQASNPSKPGSNSLESSLAAEASNGSNPFVSLAKSPQMGPSFSSLDRDL